MKALGNMERIQIHQDVMMLLLSLYESKGKSFYYDDLFSRDSHAFEKKTMEQNLIAIARILKLEMTDARIRLFAKKPMSPRTKDEHLLANVKQALHQLHKRPEDFELLVNEVGNLIKLLSKNTDAITFMSYEREEEGMLKTKKASKKDDLEKLMQLFEKNLRTKKYELTQLITNFYVDFLNMNILSTHQELVALISSPKIFQFSNTSLSSNTYKKNLKDGNQVSSLHPIIGHQGMHRQKCYRESSFKS